ncbi:unnamed protein product [Dicrocoelium dendriticum]|nr:unnamed protein product [Dicrocoelium dendriticum]
MLVAAHLCFIRDTLGGLRLFKYLTVLLIVTDTRCAILNEHVKFYHSEMASRIAGPIPTHEIYELPLVGCWTALAKSRFGGSLGNLNVPRCQANVSPANGHCMDSACGYTGKNYIRENIKRIKQYQKASLMRKTSLGNIFSPTVKLVHERGMNRLPSRPSTAVSRPKCCSKENQISTQVNDFLLLP